MSNLKPELEHHWIRGVGKTRNETEQNETEATPTNLQVIPAQASHFLLCYGSLSAAAVLVR